MTHETIVILTQNGPIMSKDQVYSLQVHMGVDMVVMTGPQLNYFGACRFWHVHACVCVITDTRTLQKSVYVSIRCECAKFGKKYTSNLTESNGTT